MRKSTPISSSERHVSFEILILPRNSNSQIYIPWRIYSVSSFFTLAYCKLLWLKTGFMALKLFHPHRRLSAGHRRKKHEVSLHTLFVVCTWKSIVRFFSALDGWTWFGALECRRRGGPMRTPSPGFLWRLPARLLQRVRNSWGSSKPESSRMHSGKDPLLHKLWTEPDAFF